MHALLALILLAAPSNGTIGNDLSAGGTATGSKLTSGAEVDGYRLTYPPPTSDAAGQPIVLAAPAAWSKATTAAYKNAAPTIIGGKPGSTVITIANSSTIGGDTLTWARTIDGVTPANVVWTEGVATYSCAALGGDSDSNRDACACLLYTYCNANLPSGVTSCSRLDGTCSDSKVYVDWSSAVAVTGATVAASDSSVTVAAGTAGQVLIPDGTAAAGALCFQSDPDTCIYRAAANYMCFTTNGVQRGCFDASGTLALVGAITAGTSVGAAGQVTAGTYVQATTYVRPAPTATLGNCAAAGDVGKLLSYLKADVTHLCYCKQTGAGAYAWTTVFAGGDCT